MLRIILTILLYGSLAIASEEEEKRVILEFIKENASRVSINDYQRYPVEDLNLSHLKQIVSLDLEDVNLTTLPKDIKYLIGLKNLYLQNNRLKELPTELFEIKTLNMLILKNNMLETIPKEIGNLNKLASLNLEYNRLKSLPKEMKNLSLANLSLNNNEIEELPKEALQAMVVYLREDPSSACKVGGKRSLNFKVTKALPTTRYSIDISNNKLSYIPKEICRINGVDSFKFHGNYFDEIPSCILKMKDLEDKNTHFMISNPFGKEVVVINESWNYYDLKIAYSSIDDKSVKFKAIIGKEFDVNSILIDMTEDELRSFDTWSFVHEDVIDEYIWKFGDRNISNEAEPIYRYEEYGEYNISLTIKYKDDFEIYSKNINDYYDYCFKNKNLSNLQNLNASKLISLYPRVLELKKGWNMITPPTKDDINTSIFEIVWSYENETWDSNHSYLIPTIGYWVKLENDLNYSYSGEVYELPNYKIKSGWNFVGSGENYYKKLNQTIYHYKNSKWLINPKEIKKGDGFWVRK